MGSHLMAGWTLRQLLKSGLLSLYLGSSLVAAELNYEGVQKGVYSPYSDTVDTHVFSLNGMIKDGDSSVLRVLLEKRLERNIQFFCDDNPSVIFLNSDGGNFSEGINLAKLFHDIGVGTIVKSKNRCLSACAVAFTGGMRNLCKDGDRTIYRRLQPGAVLGFHSPRIIVPDRDFSKEAIEKAYDSAIRQVGTLLSITNQTFIKPSLVQEMLLQGSNSFHYIDTIDKAGRWDIDIDAPFPYPLNPKELARGCGNAISWKQDIFATTANYGEKFLEVGKHQNFMEKNVEGKQIFMYDVSELPIITCLIQQFNSRAGNRTIWVRFFSEPMIDVEKMVSETELSGADATLRPVHFFRPTTKLSDLDHGIAK